MDGLRLETLNTTSEGGDSANMTGGKPANAASRAPIEWTRRGATLVASLTLSDGRPASVTLSGPRDDPNGAIVALPSQGSDGPQTVMLGDFLDRLAPEKTIELLCIQERVFGSSQLEAPDFV